MDDRERYINEFKNNRKIILCNVYVLTEGIDIPEIETIFVARPTTNQITAKQIYGRAMRLCDNKTSCTIIEGMLPDKNWLCQQTFETAYMEIPFDIHKRVVLRSLLQHIEKEINLIIQILLLKSFTSNCRDILIGLRGCVRIDI